MYAALWNVLPGPALVRVLILFIMAAVAVTVLFAFVFPWLLPLVTPLDATVQQ
ncbi:hypothetical protein [Salinibacterium sp. UTAS2018]|uniref:hypothetical protein n=1 Tax=Salinibacterium sp. UTAS2018 TaxID=2508880 RepID=UPI00143CE0E8|nr:hypothetical protein [Salinibacterium sp. UTAS2018]